MIEGWKKLSVQSGEKILEIGLGTGHCLVTLVRAVGPMGRVIGLDVSDGMLAVTRGRLQMGKIFLRTNDCCHADVFQRLC